MSVVRRIRCEACNAEEGGYPLLFDWWKLHSLNEDDPHDFCSVGCIRVWLARHFGDPPAPSNRSPIT